MTGNIIQEKKIEEFVRAYRNSSNEDISKIVAGMTAIMLGNEKTYEQLKNQKWFERIWFGLTGKNKATIEEMKAKRDCLTKYMIQILVKLNELLNDHGECIYDLYRALTVVRRDLDIVVDEVDKLAHKLNEKIISVDNYHYLLNEIRNEKFDTNTPLISLVDIMSRIDIRTAQDTKRINQIKETMEYMGFDFSRKVEIQKYAEEVFSLDGENVGRILLFCQSYRKHSRFLAFTCSLIEGYFYLWESEKRFARESGEAVNYALATANLTSKAYCVVDELFNDLRKSAVDVFKLSEFPKEESKELSPAEYFALKTNDELEIIVVGAPGSGKSTLIKSILGWSVAITGEKKSSRIERYSDEASLVLYDTISLDSDNSQILIDGIQSIIRSKCKHVVWYCINSQKYRYFNSEIKILEKLRSWGIPIIIVLTVSIEKDNTQMESYIVSENRKAGIGDLPVISVLAKEYSLRSRQSIASFGLNDLMDETIEMI